MSALILSIRILIVVLIVAIIVLAIAIRAGLSVGAAIGITAITSTLVFATLFVDQTDNAKVMLGVLKVTLRRYTIAGSLGITRQSKILFIDLKRIAPDSDIGTIAVEGLMAQRDIVLSAATIVVAPAARTPNVWSLSHSAITSPSLRFARPRPAQADLQKSPGDRGASLRGGMSGVLITQAAPNMLRSSVPEDPSGEMAAIQPLFCVQTRNHPFF
jgi:hypothetical protein